MNLSQVRNLKDGDKIKYSGSLPKLTEGKIYEVILTEIGPYIVDDRGLGIRIADQIPLEMCFSKVEE